jgi:hypothetical protein
MIASVDRHVGGRAVDAHTAIPRAAPQRLHAGAGRWRPAHSAGRSEPCASGRAVSR